ncbi:MAG: hypothetical protein HND53_12160 [Proteobacteria bacterium]|nr:hypothetical protein [Pseudomonadota bacterium]NOG61248.1 hypothetical protein [Pseudomonadota bacterium]
MKIKSDIDSEFLDAAEQEIYQILLNQHLSYNDRWFSSPFIVRVMTLLRYIGICLSLLGITLTIYVLWNKPVWCPLWINLNYLALTFILFLVIFYFMPSIDSSLKQWSRNYAFKNCKKIAGNCVKEARKLAPYLAEYEFKANTISYYRIKSDVSTLAWTRKLKGVAFHGKRATVFFKKWTAFIPMLIVLHEKFEPVEIILDNLSIDTKSIVKAQDTINLNQK